MPIWKQSKSTTANGLPIVMAQSLNQFLMQLLYALKRVSRLWRLNCIIRTSKKAAVCIPLSLKKMDLNLKRVTFSRRLPLKLLQRIRLVVTYSLAIAFAGLVQNICARALDSAEDF